MVHTMLDRLAIAPVERFHLPLPSDPRLRTIAEAMAADPADRATIGEWARRVAMSERTLSRLILRETGMSFGRWRQQFQIVFAMERLTGGDLVQSVAFDLGYESVSAFITMFKKLLGHPPGRFLATRANQAATMQECVVPQRSSMNSILAVIAATLGNFLAADPLFGCW